MNSNYRQYYLDDPQFYEIVIREEPSPYEFKIHLFVDNQDNEQSEEKPSQRDINLKLMDKLKSMGAVNISDTFMKDKKGTSDKIRFLFQIEDQ